MMQQAPRMLDYATPSGRRRFDPGVWPSVPALLVLLGVAAGLSVSVARVVPGGPFISVHGDVVPVVVCGGIVGLGWRALRGSGGGRRVAMGCVILGCVAVIASTVAGVVSFWLRPYARGVLAGW